jgi:LysM repeat protein
MQSAQTMLDQGRLSEALLALSEWYENPSTPQNEHGLLVDLLDRLAATVVYSREHLLEPAYVVRPGDTLDQIADRYQVPAPLLAKINGLADATQLPPGAALKVLRGPFDARVNLKTSELTLLLHGRYAGRFALTIGQDATTPEGEYNIKEKRTNPQYSGPGGIIEADDPNNPLGEFQLDLGNRISIHSAPSGGVSNGADLRGSLRLVPQDASDVFDMLTVGSRVTIHR